MRRGPIKSCNNCKFGTRDATAGNYLICALCTSSRTNICWKPIKKHDDRIDAMIYTAYNKIYTKEDIKMSEEKDCNSCKYHDVRLFSEPCLSCNLMKNMWEPKEDKKMENFTKGMLKNRMVVRLRNGEYYMVCGDILIGKTEYMPSLDDTYDENLRHVLNSQMDIVEVYGRVNCLVKVTSETWHLKSIWKRNDVKEVTLKEIAEKFGVDEVKVIDGND